MKIYHLADLHFGKSIYGLSMIDDQKHWTGQFLAYCRENIPDAVVISGDVYDRSAPSAEAIVLLDSLLTQLSEYNIPVLMISGNHDSGPRLSFGGSILSKQNVHICGNIKKDMDHVTFENPDGYGPVTFWLLPYTYPEQISRILEDEDIHTYDSAIRKMIQKQDIDTSQRNVILSHQNVISDGKEVERGGSESMVGGVGQIDFTAYDIFEYAALGHIHSSYSVGRPEVRYAGTPLCYHLAETRQKNKGMVEVILKEKGAAPEIHSISFEPLHKMRYLVGTREEIYSLLNDDKGKDEYIGITLTDERITPEIASYLKQLLSTRGSILLELISTYSSFVNNIASADREAVKSKPVEDLFADLYEEQSGGVPPTDDEYELMKYVGELVRNQDSHQPLDKKDVKKLLEHAKKNGGNA